MFFRLKLALRLRDCLSHPPQGEGKRSSSKGRACSESASNNLAVEKGGSWNRDDAREESLTGDTMRRKGRSAGTLEEVQAQLVLLLDDLKCEKNDELRDAAAQSCYELCIDRPEIRPLFLKLDAVDSLLELAQKGRRHAQVFASLTLTSLTSQEDCRIYLMQRGIIRLCLEQLEEPDMPNEVKRGCLRAIGRLAKFSEASEEIMRLSGLQTIVPMLSCENEGIQRRALIALYFIGADKPSIQDEFLKFKAIQPLLKLCMSSNPSVQLEAIDVCKVLSRSRSCALQFVQESGVRIFVAAASEGSSKEIKSSAYRVMQRLCNHGPEISQLIIQEGTNVAGCDLSEDGVDKLIDVFSTGVISLQEEAARIVEELCQADPIASAFVHCPILMHEACCML